MRLLVPWSYLFLFITCKSIIIIIIIINIIKTAVAPDSFYSKRYFAWEFNTW